MPKKAKALSAIEVKRLVRKAQKAGEDLFKAVGGVDGLHLSIADTGAASWILRAMCGDKRRDYGHGGYPDVTLEQARQSARDDRALIRQGIDPAEQRKAAQDALRAARAKHQTFREAAAVVIKRKQKEFRNDKHAAQWAATLETYAYPVIGNLQVHLIELAHIQNILEPIWTDKTETATRLRGRIEKVLDYATVSGYRKGNNPARWRGNLEAVLSMPGKLKEVQHHRALPIAALPGFMADLHQQKGMGARALEFAILTATRSGEVRLATWDEFDMAAKTWVIPGERMKAGKEHRVPLVPAALALLQALPRMDDSEYVFPAGRGGALSDMTLSAVCRRMKVDAVPHGFRSTFRDWCAENTNYPREVAEQALAHVIESKVEAAYRRGDLFNKRRLMMTNWAKYCASTPAVSGTVTAIRSKHA